MSGVDLAAIERAACRDALRAAEAREAKLREAGDALAATAGRHVTGQNRRLYAASHSELHRAIQTYRAALAETASSLAEAEQ